MTRNLINYLSADMVHRHPDTWKHILLTQAFTRLLESPLLTTLVFSKVACPGLLGERPYVENLSVSGAIDIACISDSRSSPLQAANQITVLWSFLEDDSALISLLLHRETIE